MDHLSNLITSLRNAEMARHTTTSVVNTKLNRAVLGVLQANEYVAGYAEEGSSLVVTLAKPGTRHHYRRISKPSRRIYTDAKSIPTVRQGVGMVVLSTSAGILSGKDARKQRLGGELLCEVY